MELNLRSQAQRRVEQIACFQRELAELEREQALILSPDQRSRLEAHLGGLISRLQGQFGLDATDSARRISWGMRLAFVLGGAALVAAAILFVHRIWGFLPTWALVGLLTAIPLGLLLAAASAFGRSTDPFYPAVLGLLAGVGFAVTLSTLGLVMNLAPSPHALLALSTFGLLTGYAFGLRLLLGAGLLLGAAYTAALALMLQGRHWPAFAEQSEFLLPAAAVLYVLPWFLGHRQRPPFQLVYWLCGAFIGLMALLSMSLSEGLCCSAFGPGRAEVIYQLLGLLLSAGVVAHGLRAGQGALVNLGAAAFVVFLYARLHAWFWDWLPKYLFFFCLGLTALALLLIFRRLRTALKASP